MREKKLIEPEKPRFTAVESLQNLFNNYPVVTHETHRVKLDKIGEFAIASDTDKPGEEKGKPASELFVRLMSSINPFAQFVIQEIQTENKDEESSSSFEKVWELDETIF